MHPCAFRHTITGPFLVEIVSVVFMLYLRAPALGGYGWNIHIWMLRKEWLGLCGDQKDWTFNQ